MPISLVAHPKLEFLGMRGIASRFVVSSLLSGKSKLGESSETTLFLLTSVWILVSWDYRRLHTSNTPISSAIRTTSMTSALTRMYRCHPCTLTLVIARNRDGMLLFNRNKLGHWLVKDPATRTTWEQGINGQTWNNDWNIRWVFWRSLLRDAQLSICFKV